MRPTDSSQEIANWFADPSRVGPLNLAPRTLTLPELRQFFAGFDNRSRFLIALIDRPTERITGFLHAEFSGLHRTSRISFLNGSGGHAGRRAIVALGRPLLSLQFTRYGIEKVAAQVLADNKTLCSHLDRIGFRREGFLRAQVRAPGGGRLDQVLFGLLPEDLQSRIGPV